jgi:hypothetical protein
MSCCGGGTDEASKKSREVDKQLRADNRQRQEEIKLLLLGLSPLIILFLDINIIHHHIEAKTLILYN